MITNDDEKLQKGENNSTTCLHQKRQTQNAEGSNFVLYFDVYVILFPLCDVKLSLKLFVSKRMWGDSRLLYTFVVVG